jgi:O-antigen ligase
MTRLLWTCGALLAVACLDPLHVLPWMSAHNEALATLAAVVGCAGALWVARRSADSARVLVPSVAALPVFVGACAVLQWAAGTIAYAGSLWTILSYAMLCAAAAAAGHAATRAAAPAQGAGGSEPLRVLAIVLLVIGLAQVLVDFGQALDLWGGADWVARIGYATRAGGNVAQPNQAAQLFVMAIVAAVYLRQAGRIGAAVTVGTLLLLAVGLASTQSRSGAVSLALVTGWYLLRRRTLPRDDGVVPALVLLVAAWGLFAAWYPAASAYWITLPEEVNLTTSGRLDIWRQLLGAVWLRPWFGWGVMQVAEAQNAIAHAYATVMAATFSHNLFLDLALWLGLPAALLAVLMLARWLIVRVPRARGLDSCFCVALVLPFALQSMTEFPYAYTYLLLPAFFALGAFDALGGRSVGWRVPRWLAVASIALWAGGSAWAVVEYAAIEEDFRVARFEALRVGRTPQGYDAPRIHLLTQLDALLRATRIQPHPGMPREDVETLRNVAMLHPWGFTNLRYATALALNGNLREAQRQLQVLRALQGRKSYEAALATLDEMSAQYPVLLQLRQP